MPNLVICLTILWFALFGPRDPATNIATWQYQSSTRFLFEDVIGKTVVKTFLLIQFSIDLKKIQTYRQYFM